MSEIMDIRIHHQLAQEYYRQQMFQRLPDPYPTMLPVPPPRTFPAGIPPRFTLPGVEVKLQNSDLWSEFHKIGTEMIITKSGRRMFPSMRLSLSGLENDQNYCILLEMVPIADCRYKFSGSQWVPAGGAEPQSPQNIYIHPDSPALGSHWQAQPILFNKVKLTNNTLDSNGHVVLTSMHKYQPRIHIIRTSDPAQIPWSPQTSFAFNETEFVAVTAYQNDRITKLKIDNNPFAKGFRETGQSRCKRKAGSSASNQTESNGSTNTDNDCKMKVIKDEEDSFIEGHPSKRIRSDDSVCSVGSLDDSGLSVCETSSSGTSSPTTTNERLLPSTSSISPSASITSSSPYLSQSFTALHHPNPNELILQRCQNMFGPSSFNYQWMDLVNMMHRQQQYFPELQMIPPYFSPTNTITSNHSNHSPNPASSHREEDEASTSSVSPSPNKSVDLSVNPVKKKSNFSILSILGHN